MTSDCFGGWYGNYNWGLSKVVRTTSLLRQSTCVCSRHKMIFGLPPPNSWANDNPELVSYFVKCKTTTSWAQILILTYFHLAISPSVHPHDPVFLSPQCPRNDYNGSRASPGSAPETWPLISDDCKPAERGIWIHCNSAQLPKGRWCIWFTKWQWQASLQANLT